MSQFDEIFDEYLYNQIIDSDLIKDWRVMGWRGIMLKNSLLWLDDNGKISSINHIPEKQKKRILQYISKDKNRVHNSIKEFVKPILEKKTKKRLFRIDLLGKNDYRYTEWSSYQDVGDKPHVIINNGKQFWGDGSLGDGYFAFKDGQYVYVFVVPRIGTEDTPWEGELKIYRINTNDIKDRPLDFLELQNLQEKGILLEKENVDKTIH